MKHTSLTNDETRVKLYNLLQRLNGECIFDYVFRLYKNNSIVFVLSKDEKNTVTKDLDTVNLLLNSGYSFRAEFNENIDFCIL